MIPLNRLGAGVSENPSETPSPFPDIVDRHRGAKCSARGLPGPFPEKIPVSFSEDVREGVRQLDHHGGQRRELAAWPKPRPTRRGERVDLPEKRVILGTGSRRVGLVHRSMSACGKTPANREPQPHTTERPFPGLLHFSCIVKWFAAATALAHRLTSSLSA